ncbi:MAG: hypothetical protein CFE30_07030 [Bradyrhizobium sp. PARBB1]|jgi:hypothetical protein|uniref:branched-chain amino acid transport system permease n=1 Tax=Bradyrhizobium sp. TaxID=376 RepID=UPI0003971017|nr:branched-chain amino acid transport system permease [Bradyrhizobium sp.]ERF85795.1 MAG: branched-chain amino acid transport system permease [Bradyrhizobium sp. DFCI-1]OYU63136.1 MAG: hypothetical protein CFE30_07030 [Bradyrhizobium sp. PARBB1]PSO23486.1 hypothetical protein C7G43_23070 [Bradyrhizobium sp. MOS004]MCA3581131.1 hypothetical protein [Bradyrhizobium sp.]HAQ82245.1 hypothetical protein [Bradyrhizobium sp.]
MRLVLALGLLVMLCAPANAAPRRHPHPRQPAAVRAPADVTPSARFAVPGWSDEATRQWLDRASENAGRGG